MTRRSVRSVVQESERDDFIAKQWSMGISKGKRISPKSFCRSSLGIILTSSSMGSPTTFLVTAPCAVLPINTSSTQTFQR